MIKGLVFFLPRDKFAPIGNNEYYLVDMIGSQVIDEYQKPIGTVSDVLVLPAQNIFVVETEENEILIPYVDAHITLFDRQKKNLIVRDVVGLIN